MRGQTQLSMPDRLVSKHNPHHANGFHLHPPQPNTVTTSEQGGLLGLRRGSRSRTCNRCWSLSVRCVSLIVPGSEVRALTHWRICDTSERRAASEARHLVAVNLPAVFCQARSVKDFPGSFEHLHPEIGVLMVF